MSLRDMLSEKEKFIFESYVDYFASVSGRNRVASADQLLRPWDEAKSEYLIRIMKNQLILSKPIEFQKGEDELMKDFDELIWGKTCEDPDSTEYKAKKFYDSYYKLFGDIFHPPFNLSFEAIEGMRTLSYAHSLAENIYKGSTFEFEAPNGGKSIKIQYGCKTIKALAKIAEAYSLPNFEDFRLFHSQVLNQKKLKGILNLSIHPIDYITMSDNEYGWSSCMSWQEEGCYRQGTVEMMNSKMVIVAYLSGERDMRLPFYYDGVKCYWSNKKWRQLFIVNENMIGDVKSYPYKNSDLTKVALTWIKELADEANYSNYIDNIFEYSSYCNFNLNYNEESRPLFIDPHTELMYNDFSSGQLAYFNPEIPSRFNFNYSGPSECMCCGETHTDFDGEVMLFGTCCECRVYCEWCEEYVSSETYELDGMTICEYCYNEHSMEDSITGEIHLDENMRKIYLIDDQGIYRWNYIYVYRDYLGEYGGYGVGQKDSLLSKYFKRLYRGYDCHIGDYYAVKKEDILPAGDGLFQSSPSNIIAFNVPEMLVEQVDGDLYDFSESIWKSDFYRNETILLFYDFPKKGREEIA